MDRFGVTVASLLLGKDVVIPATVAKERFISFIPAKTLITETSSVTAFSTIAILLFSALMGAFSISTTRTSMISFTWSILWRNVGDRPRLGGAMASSTASSILATLSDKARIARIFLVAIG